MCVKGPGPSCSHMIVGFFCTPDVVIFHLHFDRHFVDTVKPGNLVGRTDSTTFGAGPVVAIDIDDQRVVEFTDVLNGLNNATHLMVVVGGVGREDFHLSDKQLLFFCRHSSQSLKNVLATAPLYPGNHTQLLLVFENRLANWF